MVAPLLPADEQTILDLVREVYAGYLITIKQRNEVYLAKFGLQIGGGMSVNLSRLAADWRGGTPLSEIKTNLQASPR